jgi:hypothetical protein
VQPKLYYIYNIKPAVVYVIVLVPMVIILGLKYTRLKNVMDS